MNKTNILFERLVESVNRKIDASQRITRDWLRAEALSIAANNQTVADAVLATYDDEFPGEHDDHRRVP